MIQEEVSKAPVNNLNHNPSYNDDLWEAGNEQSQEWKSKSIGKLATSLAKAQAELKGAEKASDNKFFNSKYADLHKVIESSLPSLTKYGLSVVQGNRYCTLTNGFYVTTMLLHESGQWIKSEIRMSTNPGKQSPNHAIGTAVTYGRRYGLSAICGIAQFDYDGNDNKPLT